MKKYLITSSASCHEQLKVHLPEFALYRDKSNTHYDTLASNFVEVCNQFESIKCFIHQKVDLAQKLGACGVHLTSQQFEGIGYAKELGLEVIISTHTHEEVLKAQKLGADYVTYSPIFASPDKSEPKGIDDLKELLKKCDIKIFALGGIVDSYHIESINKTGTYGFASIRYFV